MITTDSGLVVPDDAITRKSRVMPTETWNRIRRMMPMVKAERLGFVLRCLDCNEPVDLVKGPELAGPHVAQFIFRCKCSDRVVR